MGSHKTIHYEIMINAPAAKARLFTYDYSASRGRNISIFLSPKGIRIAADLTARYGADQIISIKNLIFSDAIKKSLLLYLILYSKNLEIRKLRVLIDGEQTELPISQKPYLPPVYSLVDGALVRSISKKWDNDRFIEAVLSKTFSKYSEDRRWAALYAAICAKSKTYEIERFVYLWMAFNGIYQYFSEQIKSRHSKECKQLESIIKIFGLGYQHVKEEDSATIAKEVMLIIANNNMSQVKGRMDIPASVAEQIEHVLLTGGNNRYNLKATGYLLVSLPYYLRCNYFHAGRTLPLFCYADERELQCLHLVNTLLEECIDENLYLLFDDTYVEATYREKFNRLANGKL